MPRKPAPSLSLTGLLSLSVFGGRLSVAKGEGPDQISAKIGPMGLSAQRVPAFKDGSSNIAVAL